MTTRIHLSAADRRVIERALQSDHQQRRRITRRAVLDDALCLGCAAAWVIGFFVLQSWVSG